MNRWFVLVGSVSLVIMASTSCSRNEELATAAPTTEAREGQEGRAEAPAHPAPAPAEAAGAQPAAEQGQAPTSFDTPPPVGTRAHCPVMGHDFTVTEGTLRSEYNGRHYAFCCPACKPRFDADPQEFLGT